mgnify:FL=1
MIAPLCRFCRVRHFGTEHPFAALEAEWLKLRRLLRETPITPPATLSSEATKFVRRLTVDVTNTVTKSPSVTKRGRPRKELVTPNAERQRAYRERKA